MKKLIFSALVFIASFQSVKAQDQLYKMDNTKVLVKIIEVGTELIKYKLYSNLNGPTYSENVKDVSLIIYETGQHEIIKHTAVNASIQNTAPSGSFYKNYSMSQEDSMAFYKYSQSISINFLNFINNEVAMTYQAEFFKSQFNIIIPVAIGLEKPNITQSTYNFNSGNVYSNLNKKNFEIGFGINYYPSLRTNLNYFIGPVFRYLQYSGTSNLNYQIQNPSGTYPYYSSYVKTQPVTISRYCISITNGVVIRTRSRLNATFFGSMGFKNDAADKEITNPVTNVSYNPVYKPISFYFWCGFNVGFCF